MVYSSGTATGVSFTGSIVIVSACDDSQSTVDLMLFNNKQRAQAAEKVHAALRRELSEEKRKQNMNVIIAALVGVVGWFF